MSQICRAYERKLRWSIKLCSQKHEEDQLHLECRTPILKNWTISNMLTLLQMQVLAPCLEGVLDTLDMSCRPYVKQSNRMPLDVHSWN